MSGGRPPKFYRYERIRRGLPVCASDNGCPNAPNSNGYCRSCWNRLPHERRAYATRGPLGKDRIRVDLPKQLFRSAEAAAQSLRPPLSVAEWVRRAVTAALRVSTPTTRDAAPDDGTSRATTTSAAVE